VTNARLTHIIVWTIHVFNVSRSVINYFGIFGLLEPLMRYLKIVYLCTYFFVGLVDVFNMLNSVSDLLKDFSLVKSLLEIGNDLSFFEH
jgi:hypothetical protein